MATFSSFKRLWLSFLGWLGLTEHSALSFVFLEITEQGKRPREERLRNKISNYQEIYLICNGPRFFSWLLLGVCASFQIINQEWSKICQLIAIWSCLHFREHKENGQNLDLSQLISEGLFGVLNFTKKTSKKFDKFLPKNLKSGQTIR